MTLKTNKPMGVVFFHERVRKRETDVDQGKKVKVELSVCVFMKSMHDGMPR